MSIAPRILNLCTEWSCQIHVSVALLPRKYALETIKQTAGCAPELVWTHSRTEKLLTPEGSQALDRLVNSLFPIGL